jgi:uncharacterized repeat protein (TIGR03847 family)
MLGPVEGEAQAVTVEAIGEPGRRRFRLLALIDGQTHVVWMEKQQVQALGLALEQVLDQLPDTGPLFEAVGLGDFDRDARSQFRAGRMELGYEERHNRLTIVTHDLDDGGQEPALTVRISRRQARDLSATASQIVAAGRPICPLCSLPMGPGPHVCPGQNGHLPEHLDEDDFEQEA